MEQPLVSIIIPTYNRAHLIGETLDSVLAQSYTHWECIVVDDGSTDNTPEVLVAYCAKDTRFQYHKRPLEKPKGANACRNYGFELSKGEYILFLDSDDILKKSCIENRVFLFNKNKTLDFVIANTAFYTGGIFQDNPICNYPECYTSKDYLDLFLKYELPWTLMSVLWKKKSIINIKFDERLPRLQDVDFHIQVLLQEDLKCVRLNEVDTFYRSERGSRATVKDKQKIVTASRFFFKKYAEENGLGDNQKKTFRQFILLFLFRYIYPFQKHQKQSVEQVEKIIKHSRIFSNKELFFLRIYKFITKHGLQERKGIGMHKLTKALKKGLKYDQ